MTNFSHFVPRLGKLLAKPTDNNNNTVLHGSTKPRVHGWFGPKLAFLSKARRGHRNSKHDQDPNRSDQDSACRCNLGRYSTTAAFAADIAQTDLPGHARRQLRTRLELRDPSNLPFEFGFADDVGLSPLEQPWFNRRRSSLMRVCASSLQLIDEVRSLGRRPSRDRGLYVLVLDDEPVTSEGIEMEMETVIPPRTKSFTDREPRSYRYRDLGDDRNNEEEIDDDADDGRFSVSSLPQDSFLRVHRAVPTRFRPSTEPDTQGYADDRGVLTVEVVKNAPADTASCAHSRGRPRPRPAPLTLFSYETYSFARPASVQSHSCVVSETPLSFSSMCGNWSATRDRHTVIFRPSTAGSTGSVSRPGTANTSDSESFILEGW